MEQKIHNTFTRMEDEIEKFDKVFAQGGKFEQAVAQAGGDIAWFDDIREALDKLADVLMDGHRAAMPNMDEDVNEGRLGFSDMEKFGDEAASKIDMEARRRGSADMEPGDADELRYKVAKEMGYIKESTLTEGVLDADDDDGFMARSQLYFMARDAIQLHGIIGDTDDLEPWVQSKIAQAAQGIDAVRRYTEYNAMKQEMPMDGAMDMEEDEDLDEAVGKLGKYALAAMLGLGAVKGIDATSAKHSPLGQALDHAASTYSGEEAADALELYKNIDLYADEDPSRLQYWASQNQDLINQFKESTVDEGSYGKKKKKKYYEQETLESYQDRYNRVASTANAIKVNKELATMPQDAARKVSGNADYSHDKNPFYRAKADARKNDGLGPHADIVKRMKPNPTDGKFKWGRDKLADSVMEDEDEKHYMCVHAKKGTHKCTAKSSYEAAKKAAELWGMKSTAGIDAHLMEGKYKSDAQRKAVHASKAEKANEAVNEGMEFDEKRNDELQTVAKDLFANAKAAAKKKVK